MKVSKLQRDVLDALKDGWELGRSATPDGEWWLQKGGLGRGGKSLPVNVNTAFSLLKRGLIEKKRDGFPTELWGLRILK